MKKMNLYPYLLLHMENNSKWNIALKVKNRIKLLEENIKEFFLLYCGRQRFLQCLQPPAMKNKIDTLYYIKSKKFYLSKDTVKIVKRGGNNTCIIQ